MDRFLGEIDRAIKVLTVRGHATRVPSAGLAALPESGTDLLSDSERRHSARLMRVNHAGEIAAQALYRGQALTARTASVRAAMQTAAAEESDHLAWCRQRLQELRGATSVLNPLWYLGSLAIGAVAGAWGDRLSLGFVAETEAQVESHLRGHLERLSRNDARSRAILAQMSQDEMRHGANAAALGGERPHPAVRLGMRLVSKLMTRGSYWI